MALAQPHAGFQGHPAGSQCSLASKQGWLQNFQGPLGKNQELVWISRQRHKNIKLSLCGSVRPRGRAGRRPRPTPHPTPSQLCLLGVLWLRDTQPKSVTISGLGYFSSVPVLCTGLLQQSGSQHSLLAAEATQGRRLWPTTATDASTQGGFIQTRVWVSNCQ